MSQKPKDYELVGTQPSYYSAKVRSCLQYKRLPYKEVGVNMAMIGQRVIPATGDHTFPVVFCPDGTVLKDGCDIVTALEQRHPEPPLMPTDPVLNLIAHLFEMLADEFFIIAAIYHRWLPEDTREWALEMFPLLMSKGTKDPEVLQKAQVMAIGVASGIQERIKKAGLDQDDVQQECIRITTEFCDILEKHFAENPFTLGERPSLADLALMNAIWGHLYMDPCEISMHIRRKCTHLSQWVTHMHCAAGIGDQGELEFTNSAKEALGYLGTAFGEMAKAVLCKADNAIPEMEIDKTARPGMGRIETRFGEVNISRPSSTYTAWRLQRVIDLYQSLPETELTRANEILLDTGLLSICQHKPNWRLEKRDFKLVRTQ